MVSFTHQRHRTCGHQSAGAETTEAANFLLQYSKFDLPITIRNHPEALETSTKSTNISQYLIQTCTNLQNTSNNIKSTQTHRIQAKLSKILRIPLLIKNPTKTHLNDLKFCMHIPNDTAELLQLPEFHSDLYIKISPINRKTPKSQFRQFKPKPSTDFQNAFRSRS